MAVATSVYIRLSHAQGQKFVDRLKELGYSPMTHGQPGYYYMIKGRARVLIEDEYGSGDTVIRKFMDDEDGELADILEKTARAFKGQFVLRGATKAIQVVDGVDAPQAQAPTEEETPTASQIGLNPAAQLASAGVNPNRKSAPDMNPGVYQKMIVALTAEINSKLANDALTSEDAALLACRLTGALQIYTGIQDGTLGTAEVAGAIQTIKETVQDIQQDFAQGTPNAFSVPNVQKQGSQPQVQYDEELNTDFFRNMIGGN